MNIKFKIESELAPEYQWVLGIFGNFIGFSCEFVEEGEDVLIGEHGQCDIQVSHFFRNTYQSGNYEFKSYFRKEPLHYSASGKPDYLSSCFYLLSYLQEYTDYTPDRYDRFPYDASLQKYFDCAEKNLVSDYFIALYDSVPKINQRIARNTIKTKFFLSHDIDSVYGCMGDHFRPLLKKGRIGTLLQIIFNHYLRTPDYLLLDKIMDIEDAYDVKSTFFWIVRKGRGNSAINNADYYIDEKKIKDIRGQIQQRGFSNGLHKSVSKYSFSEELSRLGADAVPINRNHYLRLWLPDTFDNIETSGLKADASMGFAETIGFRNSYGLPVKPFHIQKRTPYSFTEVPLQVMDSTLKYYLHLDAGAAQERIVRFLESNREHALMSILWHNNYFFDRLDTGWLTCYKAILSYIRDNRFEIVRPQALMSNT